QRPAPSPTTPPSGEPPRPRGGPRHRDAGGPLSSPGRPPGWSRTLKPVTRVAGHRSSARRLHPSAVHRSSRVPRPAHRSEEAVMSWRSRFMRTGVTLGITLAALATLAPSRALAQASATVDAVSPGTFVTTVANATVPITLTRGDATPILGFSVNLTLTGLTATPAAITEGGFLTAGGSTTNFQVVDNGGGNYTVD